MAEWNKAEACYHNPGSLRNGSYSAAAGSFLLFIDGYSSSYKSVIYHKYFIGVDSILSRLQHDARSLYDASFSGNKADIDMARLDVQQSLAEWENLELTALFWANGNYFIIVVILLVFIFAFACMVLLYAIQLDKSKEREKNSSALNAQIISAQEKERGRIARELHDTVAQDMRYTALLADKVGDAQLSKEIRDNQSKCIDELRSMCYDLAPPDIDAGDFPSALQVLCGGFKKTTGLEVRLTIPDDTDFSFLDRDARLNMYRIVQESLANIQKHAQAHETTVFLRNSTDGKSLCLFITDDGCGMPPELVSKLNTEYGTVKMNDGIEHFGVRGIRKRVEMMGGTVVFNSMLGEGTEVAVTVPYTA